MDQDKLWEVMLEIRDSQARTETDLKYHIKRTDLLESLVEVQDVRITNVETSRANIRFLGKTLVITVSLSGGIVGIIYTLIGILK